MCDLQLKRKKSKERDNDQKRKSNLNKLLKIGSTTKRQMKVRRQKKGIGKITKVCFISKPHSDFIYFIHFNIQTINKIKE